MLRRNIKFYPIFFGIFIIFLIISKFLNDTKTSAASVTPGSIQSSIAENLQQPSTYSEDDAERVLREQRLKIAAELSRYNVSAGAELYLEAGGRPARSVLVSAWRSGSTFLGEILNAVPGNFYHYEPLHKFKKIQIRGPPHSDSALKLLKNMLNCNYQDMNDYFEFGRLHSYQLTHNTRLWENCVAKRELCLDANFTSRFCKLFPFHSMKLVRMRLKLMEDILRDKDFPNLKVVLLVRDPRGVLQSRQHAYWCRPAPDCWDPARVCGDLASDYRAARDLHDRFPGRVTWLRYEDLALDYGTQTRRLFRFLGLDVSAAVQEFLDSHTNQQDSYIYSTYRVTSEVPFKWKKALSFEFVSKIQDACVEAMELWGYRPAHNSSQMQSEHFVPIGPYQVKL